VLNKVAGSPILFLIAKLTKGKGDFAKPSKNGRKDIQFLEDLLIYHAIIRNSELMNKMKTKYSRNMCVPGFLNTPKNQSKSARKFKKAIKG
jgi:hypothetical protein